MQSAEAELCQVCSKDTAGLSRGSGGRYGAESSVMRLEGKEEPGSDEHCLQGV